MAKLRQYKRVVGIAQLLYLAGKGLKRQGVKYTTLAAILGIGAIVTNIIGEKVFGYDLPVNNLRAISLPAIVALLTLGLGNTLTGLANLFSEKVLIADANSMNLMEDRKKAEMESHLAILWDRVFKYEAKLHHKETKTEEAVQINNSRMQLETAVKSWAPDLKSHFGINEENMENFISHIAQFRPLSEKIEATKEGFIASAGFALKNYLPQKLQQSLTGCDFSLIEDWYDGAIFTSNDCKLKEQFAANSAIRGIRKIVGIYYAAYIKEALYGHPDPLWFSLTMKRTGMNVGGLINKMNKKYVKRSEPNYFDAQDFLWKKEDADNLILTKFKEKGQEILADLQNSRKMLIRGIFSPEKTEAHNQIYRMFGKDFVNALELRLDYDVEFAAGLLDYSPVDDIVELKDIMLCQIYPAKKAKRKMAVARDNLNALDTFLQQYLPALYDLPLQLRAAKIGFHLNCFKVRKKIQNDPKKAVNIFNNHIIEAEKRYTKRICLLRQHYELSRIQLFTYVQIVDDLGEYNLTHHD